MSLTIISKKGLARLRIYINTY